MKFRGALILAAALGLFADTTVSSGKLELKSAGALAFGPDGILFVGDSLASSIVAIDTGDVKPAASGDASLDIESINEKIAALLGTEPRQILIEDIKVNPISKNVYLSVSRGRGPNATPVLLRIDTAGNIAPVPLDNVKFSTAVLEGAAPFRLDLRNNPRMDTITQVGYVDGKVLVAGLSNEEFSSDMRVIPYPFAKDAPQGSGKGSTVEIYHTQHRRYETNSPIRTFVPYTINRQPFILAAYGCTPLVKIPMSELKPGTKIKGTTIAEMGYANRPLDMIMYQKDGKDFLLVANSRRSVVKFAAERFATARSLTSGVGLYGGVPFESIAPLRNVQHLAKFDDANALVLAGVGANLELKTVPLP